MLPADTRECRRPCSGEAVEVLVRRTFLAVPLEPEVLPSRRAASAPPPPSTFENCAEMPCALKYKSAVHPQTCTKVTLQQTSKDEVTSESTAASDGNCSPASATEAAESWWPSCGKPSLPRGGDAPELQSVGGGGAAAAWGGPGLRGGGVGGRSRASKAREAARNAGGNAVGVGAGGQRSVAVAAGGGRGGVGGGVADCGVPPQSQTTAAPPELSALLWRNVPRDEHGALTSIGSIGHAEGACKPCLFAHHPSKVCVNGAACKFCHFEHPPKRRLRMLRQRRF